MAEFTRRGLDIWTEELGGVEGVEIRVTNDRSLYSNAVSRFDDRMITYAYTKGNRTPDEPATMLTRANVGGVFDSLAGHTDSGKPARPTSRSHHRRSPSYLPNRPGTLNKLGIPERSVCADTGRLV